MNCPHCGKEAAIILYGYLDSERAKKDYSDNFMLGGCEVSANSPGWFCGNCRSEFGRLGEKNLGFAIAWIEVEEEKV